MTGVVRRYDAMLCWGFIRGDDGESYFLHSSEIRGAHPGVGDRVEFDATLTEKGLRAVGVRRLDMGGHNA